MRRVVVVVAVVVVAACAAAAAIVLPRVLGGSSRAVCADFTDAIGLHTGNAVSVLGVPVGKVASITSFGDHVRVSMSVDSGVDLPADVEAVTMDSSIVSDRTVELVNTYRDGPKFVGPQCIAHTRTPYGVSKGFAQINRLLGQVLGPDSASASAVGNIITTADRNLNGQGPAIATMLHQLNTTLGDSTSGDSQVRELIDNLSSLTDSFVQRWPDFDQAVTHLEDAALAFGGFADQFGRGLDDVNQFLPVLARSLQRYQYRIFGLADQVIPFIHNVIGANHAQIGAILGLVPGAVQQIPGSVDASTGAFRVSYRPPRLVADGVAAQALCGRIDPSQCAAIGKGSGLWQLIIASAVQQ